MSVFPFGPAETLKDFWKKTPTFISVSITGKCELGVYVMILNYLSLYLDVMDVILFIFRKTQTDIITVI